MADRSRDRRSGNTSYNKKNQNIRRQNRNYEDDYDRNSSERNSSNNRKRSTNSKKVISRKRVFRHRIIRFMDPGVIVFLILAVYLFGCMVLYLLKPHVTTYEVNDGSMATDYSYTGIAIRSEQVVNTDKSGYITYYARDLEKTGAQTKVYSIDETGEINSILSDDSISSTALTSEQLNQIDSDVDSFYNDFSDINYGEAYAFKQLIESTTIQLIEQTLVENAVTLRDSASFNVCNSAIDGIISYTIDGYEDLKPEDVTADMLSAASEYNPEDLREQNLVKSGDKVYKIINNDEWTIIIKTDKDIAKKLLEEEYVKVEFKKDKTKANGKVSTWTSGDDTFVSFSFTNSMIRFASDRYVDISFELDNISGLKVPKSSIAEKELYVIDKSFLTTGAAGEVDTVYYETYDNNGQPKGKSVQIDIAYETEDAVYINKDQSEILTEGATLKASGNSQERMTIGKTEKLKGVYEYNKGYAVFCPINILYEGKEYCIISAQSKYGLAKYDYIVLNSDAIDDAVSIYQ